MKKIAILSLCFVLLLAVFAYSASAAVVVTNNFGEETATFGGDDQKASNPDLDDDDNDYDIYVDGTVGLRNDGTSAVTVDGISVEYKMGFTSEDLNITLKEGATINGSNSTGSIKLHARISEKLDAVNTHQKAVGFNVATITLRDGSSNVASFEAYMQRENQLEIDKVKVEVGDKSTNVNEDGDKVDEVKPGDAVKITVVAENKYSDNDDIDIDADDGEWSIGGDIDEEDDIDYGEIDADTKDELDFDFVVDEDVDDGTEDFIIYVYGEDNFGAKHGHRIEADFKVEKKKHEIKIDTMTVIPTSGKCGDSVTVNVKVFNIGKKDEDNARVRITNSDLEIDDISDALVIDKGDYDNVRFDFKIPADAEVGSKAFTVVASYDMDKESDRETFNLDVEACTAEPEAPEEDEEEEDTTPVPPAVTGGTVAAEPTADSTGPSAPAPITTVSRSGSGFRDSTVYVLLLILAIVIVVLVGAFLIAKVLIGA
jgi:hypothetical protein